LSKDKNKRASGKRRKDTTKSNTTFSISFREKNQNFKIKLFERSEFLILGFDDRVLAFFQPALDLFSIPFFCQEKTRNKPLERKEVEKKEVEGEKRKK